jgi:hypothetical protein
VVNGTMVVVFYEYRPNKAASFAFMALFALATIGHLIYLFRLRAWYFIPLVLGGIGKNDVLYVAGATIVFGSCSRRGCLTRQMANLACAHITELFGHYGRALSHDQPDVVGPWIMQNLLILAAAPMLAATLYMSAGRIITALDARQYTLVSPR